MSLRLYRTGVAPEANPAILPGSQGLFYKNYFEKKKSKQERSVEASSPILPMLEFSLLNRVNSCRNRYELELLGEQISEEKLWTIVDTSKTNPKLAIAASNALSALNLIPGLSFSGRDLQSIHAPYADLSGSVLHRTDLSMADLSEANFARSHIVETRFVGAKMNKIRLGVSIFQAHDKAIRKLLKHPSLGIISAGNDGKIRIWSSDPLSLQKELIVEQNYLSSCAVSVDGQWIAIGGDEQILRLWNTTTWKEEEAIHFDGKLFCLEFSEDGKTVVIGNGSSLNIYDRETKTMTLIAKNDSGHIKGLVQLNAEEIGVGFFGNGDEIPSLSVWNIKTRKKIAAVEGVLLLNCLIASQDGQRLLVGVYQDIKIFSREGSNLKLETTLEGHAAWVDGLVLDNGERKLLSVGSDKSVKVWDLLTKKIDQTYDGLDERVLVAIETSYPETYLLGDEKGNFVFLDTMQGQDAKPREKTAGNILSMITNPTCQLIVVGKSNGQINIHCYQTGKQIQMIQAHVIGVSALALSTNTQMLFSGDQLGLIQQWDEKFKLCGQFKGHTDWIESLSVSPGGQILVSGSRDNSIRIWNIVTGHTQIKLEGFDIQGYHIKIVKFINNTQIISATRSGTILSWNLPSTQPDTIAKISSLACLAISSDGSQIVYGTDEFKTGFDNRIYLMKKDPVNNQWRTTHSQELGISLASSISYIDINSNNTAVGIAYGMDNFTKFCGIASFSLVDLEPIGIPLRAHEDRITALQLQNTVYPILTASCDGSIRKWELDENGSPFLKWTSHTLLIIYGCFLQDTEMPQHLRRYFTNEEKYVIASVGDYWTDEVE